MADSTGALTDATRGIGVLASACRSTSPNDTWYMGCFASCRRARCHQCMCRACPVCTQRPPSDSPKVAPLAWERDVAWYRERIISDALRAPFRPATRTSSGRPAGCCPTAVALYKDRYRDFRCCTGRLNQLPPLRPRGGLGWPRVASLLANLSIYLVGDSLAEQHFLALACLAWATPGFAANLVAHSVPSSSNTRPAFERVARVVIEPIGTTILLTKTSRYNPSMALPSAPHVTDAIQTASFVVVGGWHHHIDRAPARLASLLDRISQMRTRRPTIVVERLPSHFPGGRHLRNGAYPPLRGSREVCERAPNQAREGISNRQIENETRRRKQYGVRLLKVSDLYATRSEAHVGVQPGTDERDRDCLHWCIVPGVLDMLARATLGECASHLGLSQHESSDREK